jgi:hypothetical protein
MICFIVCLHLYHSQFYFLFCNSVTQMYSLFSTPIASFCLEKPLDILTLFTILSCLLCLPSKSANFSKPFPTCTPHHHCKMQPHFNLKGQGSVNIVDKLWMLICCRMHTGQTKQPCQYVTCMSAYLV